MKPEYIASEGATTCFSGEQAGGGKFLRSPEKGANDDVKVCKIMKRQRQEKAVLSFSPL